MKIFIAYMLMSFCAAATTIQELNKDRVYFAEIANDLYFVADKIVSPLNFASWQLMTDFQGKWASEVKTRFPEKREVADGTETSSGSLLSPLCDFRNMEAWVIYITTKKPNRFGFRVSNADQAMAARADRNILAHFKDQNEYDNVIKEFEEKASSIEMVIGVSTNNMAPFQNHQGIFRNLKYILDGNKEHRGIAIPLQAFAAKWSLQVLKNKKYALVAPMTAMATILRSNLSQDAYYVGRNNKVLQVFGDVKAIDHKNFCAIYKPSSDFHFTLFAKSGEQLLSLNNHSIYPWALSKLALSSSYELYTINLDDLAKKWDDYTRAK